ncbi:MAG: HSP90 family molecular chaperone-like protein [Candidatus Gottesmanbacteria bacterium GW2011_GWC2_39_8]|uniref:HSP90 family molecular chaperone-like protein n=1 Tax=Candidatus Gottesmanbacteria bacterium GW2011_GWC2_39_8 TaxID=1618450 RepID=A0A0G0Q995_9BACT|nr:MAG: HSP90 family molecular chaperone-like protein [Candidatus Gottesmanbacteria bacterium GW2011_GWC2_39_8]
MKPVIGRQLFDVLTSGMYDDPLMIFREYIQNSVDSIDLAVDAGQIALEDASISISLNGSERSIVIEDNGVGINNEDAGDILINLGCSPKEGKEQRGFRGIGRLGGLAYCDELIFETRSTKNENVFVLTWDRKKFEKLCKEMDRVVTLEETIRTVANVRTNKPKSDDPTRFFRVTMRKMTRFHTDELMNFKKVYDYLAQVAPVPYSKEDFSFAETIERHVSPVENYRSYKILLNGKQIFRPYRDDVCFSNDREDRIQEPELFTFSGEDGELIAFGWYAKTNFLAAIPDSLNIRGIRIRSGNIAIGDEHALDDKYTERRFSAWQIGEIHVVRNRIKPNARRDNFEQSKNYEKFLEQASLLCRHLSNLCRKSSRHRVLVIKGERIITRMEDILNGTQVFIDQAHYRDAFRKSLRELDFLERDLRKINMGNGMLDRIGEIRAFVEKNDFRPIMIPDLLDKRSINQREARIITDISRSLLKDYSKCRSAEDAINMVLHGYVKNRYKNSISIS